MLEGPLSNAAVEGLRATFEMLNSLDEPPADFSGMAEDFVYEDHRSGGVNFGRLDASGWLRFMGSLWVSTLDEFTARSATSSPSRGSA